MIFYFPPQSLRTMTEVEILKKQNNLEKYSNKD